MCRNPVAAVRAKYARLVAGGIYWVHWCRGDAILSQGLKFAQGLLVLVVFQWLGESVVVLTGFALPGPLVGMLLLLVTLSFVDRLFVFLDKTGNLLIGNLSLMFIPISVGAFFLNREIYQQFPAILSLIFLSTIGVIFFMAILVKELLNRD